MDKLLIKSTTKYNGTLKNSTVYTDDDGDFIVSDYSSEGYPFKVRINSIRN